MGYVKTIIARTCRSISIDDRGSREEEDASRVGRGREEEGHEKVVATNAFDPARPPRRGQISVTR